MGLLIKKGMTRLIAGYDPSRVHDEKGLASWVGACFMIMGAAGVLAGTLMYLLPSGYAFVPVIVYAIVVPVGAITAVVGAQRYAK
jgi:hypothetical protein